MKQIHKIIALVSVPFLLIGCGTEQTTAPDPEPLVINTPEDGDRTLVTVMDDGEVVYQYDGELELWKGVDGKCYAIIHVDQGLAEQTKGANNE